MAVRWPSPCPRSFGLIWLRRLTKQSTFLTLQSFGTFYNKALTPDLIQICSNYCTNHLCNCRQGRLFQIRAWKPPLCIGLNTYIQTADAVRMFLLLWKVKSLANMYDLWNYNCSKSECWIFDKVWTVYVYGYTQISSATLLLITPGVVQLFRPDHLQSFTDLRMETDKISPRGAITRPANTCEQTSSRRSVYELLSPQRFIYGRLTASKTRPDREAAEET